MKNDELVELFIKKNSSDLTEEVKGSEERLKSLREELKEEEKRLWLLKDQLSYLLEYEGYEIVIYNGVAIKYTGTNHFDWMVMEDGYPRRSASMYYDGESYRVEAVTDLLNDLPVTEWVYDIPHFYLAFRVVLVFLASNQLPALNRYRERRGSFKKELFHWEERFNYECECAMRNCYSVVHKHRVLVHQRKGGLI